MKKSIKPIFITGSPRSGTTWLANILCGHSRIAGIQRRDHFGIKESGFFSHVVPYFGKLKTVDDYLVFALAFSKSTYFKISQIDENFLLNKIYYNYFEFFKDFMDEFTRMNGCDFWLEKTPEHSFFLDEIKNNYNNVKFIAIKRDIIPQTISFLLMLKDKSKITFFNILRSIPRYHIYNKKIRQYAFNNKNIMLVNFEDLLKFPKNVINKILTFLNLSFEVEMLDLKYEKNTSYKNKKNKNYLNNKEKLLIKIIDKVLKSFPLVLLQFMQCMLDNQKNKGIGRYFFSDFKKAIGCNIFFS